MADGDEILVSRLRFHRVRRGTPVGLQVIVGNGQPGGTFATWEGGWARFPGEDTGWHEVGEPGQDLVNTVLHCVTTVQDKSATTDWTSVTYRLAGGQDDVEFPFEVQVQEQGVAIYSVRFALVA